MSSAGESWAKILFGAIVGVLFTYLILDSTWKREAIKNGNGEYSKDTGAFKWIDHNKESEVED